MHDSTTTYDRIRPLLWTEAGLQVLDQRFLPERTEYRLCTSAQEVAEAIRTMQVRGAPAIGIAAAFGVVLAARQRFRQDPKRWKEAIEKDFAVLAEARPTAVNLAWALARMRRCLAALDGDPEPALLAEAQAIQAEDLAANRRMGRLGAELIGGAKGILTHCNTGSLATSGFGTALGVVRALWQRAAARGETLRVYATETRPWLQGARLTLWELEQDGIPATLICDSAAALLMRRRLIDWVVVGADRIAANGDVANKIGTYQLAVAARYHGIGFMVVAPTSTIDWNLPHGDRVPIEERSENELLPPYFQSQGKRVQALNPVFDVTPAALISALVTERGLACPPTAASLRTLRAP
ncbi:S-methyl-5-thioribose-1-phosphate isomerase [Methylothermus subterraneus]